MEELFEQWAGERCLEVRPLAANGSNRKYYRLIGVSKQCVAVKNDDIRENEAFVYFAKAFAERGIKVPEIYAVDPAKNIYLQEDLGDVTLYSYLFEKRQKKNLEEEEQKTLFRKALADLVEIQTRCKDVDFGMSYPREAFDRQSIQWDLNYFKYYFLKLAYIPFDEQLLEDDYSKFIDYLLDEDCSYFLYRDFQARNIMLKDGELYYIDFQGGRRGALHYDVAALLYSAKSELPQETRDELLEYYMDALEAKLGGLDKTLFRQKFYGYVLARMMQAMGAYGYRGYFEKKDYFVRSIPLAVNNLRHVLNKIELPIEVPHLLQVLHSIAYHEDYQEKDKRLSVKVFSFSYKKGIPPDKSGNGGGFVFDCRGLPNPGKYDEYRHLCGKDQPVIDFLRSHSDVEKFLEYAEGMVGPTIETYIGRGFSSLMVCFGCTGGQHRSVYCAEQMAEWVRTHFDCRVVLRHIEQDGK